ncbi:hypothetical protein [Nocardia pseudobrasiliensis]|uniref:hypothetical protein n=1 Tax=Nocardia pseudobrasiliensis TaxID=45979 RepID=UPI0011C03DEB|nr:hypothetical protein [Nocardia pseudobrasiliensis]
MTGERFDEESGVEALNRVRHWDGLLPRAEGDPAAYEEVSSFKLVAAAEALTFGVDERLVQAAGNYSARQMCEVREVAAEIHADNAEIERETRASMSGGPIPRPRPPVPEDRGRRDKSRRHLRLL